MSEELEFKKVFESKSYTLFQDGSDLKCYLKLRDALNCLYHQEVTFTSAHPSRIILDLLEALKKEQEI